MLLRSVVGRPECDPRQLRAGPRAADMEGAIGQPRRAIASARANRRHHVGQRAADRRVCALQRSARKRRLRRVFGHQHLGRGVGLAAQRGRDREPEIDAGRDASPGEHVAIDDDALVHWRRPERGQHVPRGPVRGGAAAPQQSGMAQQQGPGAHAGHQPGRTAVPAEEVHGRGMLHRIQRPGGAARDEDHVHRVRHIVQPCGWLDRQVQVARHRIQCGLIGGQVDGGAQQAGEEIMRPDQIERGETGIQQHGDPLRSAQRHAWYGGKAGAAGGGGGMWICCGRARRRLARCVRGRKAGCRRGCDGGGVKQGAAVEAHARHPSGYSGFGQAVLGVPDHPGRDLRPDRCRSGRRRASTHVMTRPDATVGHVCGTRVTRIN
jgi:hypothetical protein